MKLLKKIGRTHYVDAENAVRFLSLCNRYKRSTSWLVNALMDYYSRHPEDLAPIIADHIAHTSIETTEE